MTITTEQLIALLRTLIAFAVCFRRGLMLIVGSIDVLLVTLRGLQDDIAESARV